MKNVSPVPPLCKHAVLAGQGSRSCQDEILALRTCFQKAAFCCVQSCEMHRKKPLGWAQSPALSLEQAPLCSCNHQIN